jgi:succinate-semialdehyde dehydrogenase/glutarate-semialdehyde dehydrogenase
VLPVGAPAFINADRYARLMTSGLRVLKRLPGVK